MKIAVITPTYNEAGNIERFIEGILGLNVDNLNVIVVDDGSPDGTGILVEKMKSKDDRIHIIHRDKKKGLGTAYLEGFKYALGYDTEYFIGIDADFSHDFRLIPKFIQEAEKHDLVVGSRYVQGGKIENWDFLRKVLSAAGNIYARSILKVPVRDLTTGYKCYRRSAIEYLIGKEIDAVGYVFLTETTYHTYVKKFSITEIPITFTGRIMGESKLDLGIILESFWKILKLRLKK